MFVKILCSRSITGLVLFNRGLMPGSRGFGTIFGVVGMVGGYQ
jgi:hypothetical protein